MSQPRQNQDAGQAFPIYITVVAGLLFLALAYLAVGQASVNRSGAQTAADAAALAAAQNKRDELAALWLDDLQDPAKWPDILDGTAAVGDPCWRAGQLAVQNDSRLDGCNALSPLKYQAEVTNNKSVGDSVVPTTENIRATATAIAEIEPLCSFKPLGEDAEAEALPELTCDGKVWELDPDNREGLPKPEDLFDVHLAD
ncbi:pilus assembly protein TadG-related protein [Streptomyces sp. 2231.1]|uniref:pilus assembly protein TadG-related protein n=1 Tax=Streptomyces sp. 2231.1 TaxID=1855347 RepID=UPI000B815F68|nr:pilus assembly protein TadG-related protein [Streptomyces sp. 2231.1]